LRLYTLSRYVAPALGQAGLLRLKQLLTDFKRPVALRRVLMLLDRTASGSRGQRLWTSLCCSALGLTTALVPLQAPADLDAPGQLGVLRRSLSFRNGLLQETGTTGTLLPDIISAAVRGPAASLHPNINKYIANVKPLLSTGSLNSRQGPTPFVRAAGPSHRPAQI